MRQAQGGRVAPPGLYVAACGVWAFLACAQLFFLVDDGGGLANWLLLVAYSTLAVAYFHFWRTRRPGRPAADPRRPDQDA